MPDPHRIAGELSALLSRSWYSSLFYHRNEFRNPKDPVATPASIAEETSKLISRNNPFVDPVVVEEQKGRGLEFYRAHDGASDVSGRKGNKIHTTSGTLGGFWVERSVLQTIWSATQRWQGKDRDQTFMEMLRAANFIHPQWNHMKEIACMKVPDGLSVVVVRGRGNWKAMQARPGSSMTPAVSTPGEVIDRLGMMPIPGVEQCLIPLFNDMWVQPVPRGASWPLLA